MDKDALEKQFMDLQQRVKALHVQIAQQESNKAHLFGRQERPRLSTVAEDNLYRDTLLQYKKTLQNHYGKQCPCNQTLIQKKFLTQGSFEWLIVDEAVEKKDELGNTPLHLLAFYGETRLLSKVVHNNQLKTLNQPNKAGFTPLHLAVIGEQRGTVDILLRIAKVDPNVLNKDQETALDIANKFMQNWHRHYTAITKQLSVFTQQSRI